MSKNAKILISLICLALVLVIYLIVSSRSISVVEESKNEEKSAVENQIDLSVMKNEYQDNIKDIFAEMENIYVDLGWGKSATATNEQIISTSSSSLVNADNQAGAINKLRERLIKLKVPKEYKQFHLGLVLLMDKFEAYIEKGRVDDDLKNTDPLTQVKKDNPWLSS